MPELASLAVVIPMYNEEAGAEECVRAVSPAITALGRRTALVAVNDASSDRTGAILASLQGEFPGLSIVSHDVNLGYGAGLKSGARHAAKLGADYVLFMDSDLTNDPKFISDFAGKIDEGYDLVKASRYTKGGGVSGVPVMARAISRAGNLLAGVLFGLPIRDCTNGFRAVRTELFCKMELAENRFPIIMEELYWIKRWNAKTAEIPYILTYRKAGRRPRSFSYRPSTFYRYIKYPLMAFFGVDHGSG